MTDDIRSDGAIGGKIIFFLLFMFIDFTMGSLALFMDNTEGLMTDARLDLNPNYRGQRDLAAILGMFVFPAVQMGVQICNIFWFFSLIWKTFLFKFAALDKLGQQFQGVIWLLTLNFFF